MDSTRDWSSLPSVPDFFSGQCVFITGASGFMGKVLVEKILRSCPEVDTLYLLLRPKKGKEIRERLHALTDVPLFDKLQKERPEALNKLKAVQGDVSELNLGLSLEDWQVLQERVSIVFHMAASVRFDDPIMKAVLINVRGTREVVQLASGMKQLKILVHVSTSYCNTKDKIVHEHLYEAPADWRTVIEMVETCDPFQLRILTRKLMGYQPNTYTFAKALAEHIINDHREKLPVTIIRPSIVISSAREPVPGWIDNFNGPLGLFVGAGKGVVHVTLCKDSARLDYIPVDIACKALITAGWYEAHHRSNSLPVYHCSACDVKRITQGEVINIGTNIKDEVPFNNILYYPWCISTQNILIFYFMFVLTHIIPAVLVDGILKLNGKPTGLLKIQRRIFNAILCLTYFTCNDWKFENHQIIELSKFIRPEDEQDFQFMEENLDEVEFFRDATIGCRLYLLKEGSESLPAARRHLKRMALLHYGLCSLMFLLPLWYAVSHLAA
ncbi:fatty acyl-CoA reductase 1 [Anabrus simplex]|uniref:fatty acyl-CoA reductase 1 n=1 Tax=Anabrus simplex TaxID=316456 RepID=UPI0035A30BE3